VRPLTPTDVRDLLARHGVRASRALGQHFLADPNTARRIVRLADVREGDHVLEIGPGIGSLTVALAATGADVVALELDRHVLPVLDEVLENAPNVRVVLGDALTVDYGALLDGRPGALVANLPYNIATPLVADLLERVPLIVRMLVMVQREVGERLAAPPGTRACGAVSAKVSYYATTRIVGTVPPTVFVPRPKVDSALVEIVRRTMPPVDVVSPEQMFTLVRAGFAQRRKTLRQSLRPALGDRAVTTLTTAGIDPSARAETLSLERWADLARAATT
jgi:16S rRNA (adenine1518-N6/adenine1519-N6)-dimethyltransferase